VTLEWAGPILALVTFGTIAAGHVLVRRLQARYGTRPALLLFILGGLVLAASLAVTGRLLSGVLGVTATTLVWDGVEIFRQEKRVRRQNQ
jgi:hypothetical protein